MQKLHQFRMRQYESIERYVYAMFAQKSKVTIYAVSAALKEYLVATFGTPPHKIVVENADIPKTINSATIIEWRAATRSALNINQNAYVYVYNGSAKAWQCPEQTIDYFAEQYKNNFRAFLLILTNDTSYFINVCKQAAFPLTAYHVVGVPHTEIYRYLAAADAGIILRKPHILNWVSRPTKILEYQAVGLKIIHNKTVGMLAQNVPMRDGTRCFACPKHLD